MTTYEELLTVADQHDLQVKEHPLISHDGLIKGKRIAIRKTIPTQSAKSCVLAEELGHHCTTTGDILDQSNAANRKQELQARTWAYNRMIGLMGIINAFEHGCKNLYETAAYLDVTEEFLQAALQRYRQKYGVYTQLDNYIIYFEPNLGVMKRIQD